MKAQDDRRRNPDDLRLTSGRLNDVSQVGRGAYLRICAGILGKVGAHIDAHCGALQMIYLAACTT